MSILIRDTIFFIFALCKDTNIFRHTHKTASVLKFRNNFRLDSELLGKLLRLFSVVFREIIQSFGIVTQLVVILDAEIFYRFKAQLITVDFRKHKVKLILGSNSNIACTGKRCVNMLISVVEGIACRNMSRTFCVPAFISLAVTAKLYAITNAKTTVRQA